MKTLGVLLLVLAGGILFWIGRSAAPADYVPPRAPDAVPLSLTGEVRTRSNRSSDGMVRVVGSCGKHRRSVPSSSN